MKIGNDRQTSWRGKSGGSEQTKQATSKEESLAPRPNRTRRQEKGRVRSLGNHAEGRPGASGSREEKHRQEGSKGQGWKEDAGGKGRTPKKSGKEERREKPGMDEDNGSNTLTGARG